MGGSNTLGLLFEINADPGPAQAAMERFERETGKTIASMPAAVKPFNDSLITSRETARLLSEEFGLHLPRAITSAMVNVEGMGAALTALGPIAIGVFAAMEFEKLATQINAATQEALGFGKTLKKGLDDDTEALRKLLTGFGTIADGQLPISQTLEKAAELSAKREELVKKLAETPWVYGLKVAMIERDIANLDKELLANRKLLLPQLDQLGKLEKEHGKEATAAGKAAVKASEEWLKQCMRDIAEVQKAKQKLAQEGEKLATEEQQWRFKVGNEVTREEERETAAATHEAEKLLTVWAKSAENRIVLSREYTKTRREEEAANRVALAAENEAIGAGAIRLTAALGHRRIAAGMEAAWEGAKSIAAFAEWDIRGGILHGMAAAEYGIIAGTGGGHHGGVGAGGYGYGGREPRYLDAQGREGRGGAASPGGSGGGGVTIINNVQGHLMVTPEWTEFIMAQINENVDNRDGELHASRVKDSTLTRDSFNG